MSHLFRRCVHLYACVFFRVKEESAASPEDVASFYSSRGVDENVSYCWLGVNSWIVIFDFRRRICQTPMSVLPAIYLVFKDELKIFLSFFGAATTAVLLP